MEDLIMESIIIDGTAISDYKECTASLKERLTNPEKYKQDLTPKKEIIKLRVE